jgi:hypothetical protein
MPCRTMSMLANEALRRLKAKPACEMGGILWGKQSLDKPQSSLVIEEAQLVPSNGALYNSSPLDSSHLVRALQGARKPDLAPVGYFRSHIRDGLALSAEDQAFIKANMRDPNAVFLLIRPFEIGICMGGFFFWQEGQLQTDGSDLEVPFLPTGDDSGQELARPNVHSSSVAVLPVRSAVRPQVPSSPPARVEETPQPKESAPPPHTAATGKLSSLAIIGLAALALVIISGAWALFSLMGSRAPAPSNTGVGLRVSRLDTGQLDLSWNRDAAEIKKAETAKLAITDGPLREELNIDSAQLHLGRLVYFPNGSDVQFRLEVFLKGNRSLTESVRVIAPAVKSPAPSQRAATSKGPAHRPAASAQGTVAFVSSSAQDEKSQRQFRSPELVTNRPPLPAHQNSRPIPAPDIRLEARNDPPPATLAALPKPPASAPVQEPIHSSGQVPKSSISTFVPPHPVREVMPDIRLLGPSAISSITHVAVRVRIDEAGAVADAAPVSDAKSPNRLLAAAAVNAAKQWKFTPGTIHGKPVATDHTIIFEFRPRTP